MRHIVSQLMSCATITICLSAPSVSIIADDVESALSYCATTTARCCASSIATARKARLISTLPRSAHLVSLPPARSQQIGPCDLEQSHSCKPRIAYRASGQSGLNELASLTPAAPSRERDLTDPSRFPNQIFNDSCVVGFWRAYDGGHDVEVGIRAWTLA